MNFIEKNGKKIAIALCFATCVPVISTVYAYEAQPGWHGEGADRYYVLESTREQATGWLHLDEGTYYFNEEGEMVFGWQEIDSKWYYFGSKSKGYMYKNAWIKEKGKNTYYVGSDGSRCTGWYTGKNTYYFDKKGRLVTGSASCQCKHHQDHDSGSGGRKL